MRRRITKLTGIVLVGLLAACGGGDSTGPAAYNSIAGSYSGPISGTSQGVAASLQISLTIAQTDGALSGTWSMTGVLTDGITIVPVQGTGTLSGTIARGNNPSVNITILSPACPNYSAHFSGAFDTANQRLTMSGPIDFFAANSCTVALSYSATIIMTK